MKSRDEQPRLALADHPQATIRDNGARRIESGHPWVYRSDVVSTTTDKPGPVAVLTTRGRHLGYAFHNPASEIRLRMCAPPTPHHAHDAREIVSLDWLYNRLDRALAFRRTLAPAQPESGERLVHGEADGLPGIIIDRFHNVAVIQTLNQTADLFFPHIITWLEDRLANLVTVIVERNDSKVRTYEKLEQRARIIRGELSGTVTYREGDITLRVDPLAGQKTGGFLDQRDNRITAARYARRDFLDVFSYHGGFLLHAAKAILAREGKGRFAAIEASADACARIRENAADNAIDGVDILETNAFDYLREAVMRGDRWMTISLDPPAFAKTRDARDRAIAGYKEINLRAFHLLEPGGILITSTCSHHMSWADFGITVAEAAADAHREVQILERRQPAPDHPERLNFPEGSYLKCLVLRVL